MRLIQGAALSAAMCCMAGVLCAQRPVSRADAIAAVLARSPALVAAAADTTAAGAALLDARTFANPTLNLSATRDAPQRHITADIPVDFPWLRRARIASARLGRAAAVERLALARASLAFDADTAYTSALVAAAHAELSRQNAVDADSLRRAAELRRDAGDVSDLDVALAAVAAGQAANQAASDSLSAFTALLNLQTLMGEPAGRSGIVLADSLVAPDTATGPAGVPLAVRAAEYSLSASDQALVAARRAPWGSASIQLGADFHDETQRGYLPLLGLAIPLPLFNRGGAAVAAAQADRDRARAELRLVQQESARDILRVRSARDAALGRVARDRTQQATAARVVDLSRLGYQEGAAPLATVLQAQALARDARAAFIDDAGAAQVAAAALRLLTTSSTVIQQ